MPVESLKGCRPNILTTTAFNGGFIFAEDPVIPAPAARIIWSAALDPGALQVRVVAGAHADPESIDPVDLAPWLTTAIDRNGHEHAVLSDGLRHIRIDLVEGVLVAGAPVVFHYLVEGRTNAEAAILPLRRLLHLFRHRRFSASLFPHDPRVAHGLQLLQVYDALTDGATHRQIAGAIVGTKRVAREWDGPSDSLRSTVRRLVGKARRLAKGGYRSLLRTRL